MQIYANFSGRLQRPRGLFHKRNVRVKCMCKTRGLVVAKATSQGLSNAHPYLVTMATANSRVLHLHFFYETGPRELKKLRPLSSELGGVNTPQHPQKSMITMLGFGETMNNIEKPANILCGVQ